MILFPNGIQGLSDSKWSGPLGSAHRLVGIDYRSEPGVIQAHQKLSKISASVVDELCKVSLPLSDGSTLWFSSESGKIWREVSDAFSLLGTLTLPGYDFKLNNATSSGGSYTYTTQVNIPTSHFFKSDGTKLYVICNATVSGNSGEIFEYDLASQFLISTASYSGNTFAADQDAVGMFIKPDGTKLYICEDGGSNSVIEYNLGTAWDISTASASGDTYSYSAQFSRGYGIWFKPDGTEMYITSDGSPDAVYQYTLSSAWDITTASYTGVFDPTSDSYITTFSMAFGGLFFSDDGTVMIMTSTSSINGVSGGENIAKFELTTPWDVTTAEYRNGYDLPSGRYFGVMFYEDLDGDQGFIAADQSTVAVFDYTLGSQSSAASDASVTVLSAEEYGVADGDEDENGNVAVLQYVYFTTENWILRILVSDVTDIATPNENKQLALFLNSDDTYHPTVVANNRLFIGDKYNIVEVNESGVITLATNLSVREPERITLLHNFDVDILVTTKRLSEKSRVLRWDTESETWFGEDNIYEGEVHAFIDDDNFTYAVAGDFGQMHYYDGEKLLKRGRIPGPYSSSKKCKVNPNAVAYLMGVPVFGVSNVTGNPNLQGVYSFGQYDVDYPISLDLSYPISSGEFSGIEIGSVIVQGTDMYVSWKSGTAVGVDKLDWTTKYYGAYIETMVLNGAEDRSQLKALDNVLADYIEMPASTAVVMQYSVNYAAYVTFTQLLDTILYQLRAKETVPEIGAITLKFTFNTNSNDSPRIENFHANFAGEDQNDS